MADMDSNAMGRRGFIQTGVVAAVARQSLSSVESAAQDKAPAAEKAVEIPKRVLGKTGMEVTILNAGTARAPGALERLLRFEFSRGVRFFDTASTYGTEGEFKKWFAAEPAVRKQIVLATKDGVARPSEMIDRVDKRLEALGTDYIDLLYFHGPPGKAHDYGLTGNELDWPKSQEMKETIAAIKKTGKVRFVGFATHDRLRAEQLEVAAEGGLMDVIMIAMNPWLEKDSKLNKAIDACHKKNIGLVSMKLVAGNLPQRVRVDAEMLKRRGLNAYQGVLQAMWTDERIASACVGMANTEQITQNTDAARRFEPMKPSEIQQLRLAMLNAGPILCAECDGRCALAAGTSANLGDLTRILTYHEHHGARRWARNAYDQLTEAERNWHGADLEAAREACPTKLDFAELLPEVDRLLG